jgi:hypothetical protein
MENVYTCAYLIGGVRLGSRGHQATSVAILSLLITGCSGAKFSAERGHNAASRDIASAEPSSDAEVRTENAQAETSAPVFKSSAPVSPPAEGLLSAVVPTSSQEPPGAPPKYDPVTQTFSLSVETSAIKPITNLYLIVDNSFSMSVIQAKVAAAIEKLMRQVQSENLNINIYLYTTTEFASPSVKPVLFTDNGISRSVALPNFTNGFSGGRGNASFARRAYFEEVNGVRKLLASPHDRLGSSFWVSDEVVLGASQFAAADGVIRLRENMSITDIKSLVDTAVSNITALGTSGSDSEQPIAALYRLSRMIPTSDVERAAFWLVTNEDDQTPKGGVLLGHETRIGPQSSVSMYGQVQYTSIAYTYEYLQNATMVDGVVTKPAAWIKGKLVQNAFACKANVNCNTVAGTQVCTESQLKIMRDKLASLSPNSARAVSSPICTATLGIAQLGSASSTKLTDSCSSIDSTSGKTFSQLIQDRYPGELFNSVPCSTVAVSPFVAGMSKKIIDSAVNPNSSETGTAEYGKLALQNLDKALGPKGYTVALVANDGVNACGQAQYADASRLGAFLAKTPTPDLRLSVCSEDYGSIIRGIKTFIALTPKRIYNFSVDESKIKSVSTSSSNGILTTLEPSDYTVKDGLIEFRPGIVAIGDQVKFTVYE